jgi:hypothetical protein
MLPRLVILSLETRSPALLGETPNPGRAALGELLTNELSKEYRRLARATQVGSTIGDASAPIGRGLGRVGLDRNRQWPRARE